mmetsp:Transcript_13009/g.24408  ORF Transcript_13009/g.24408 Transcript_13009/m.24408 type:complete len:186 (-) Transcript_13009:328-885(-)
MASQDNNLSCRITRADRPCLVCPGHMDLVEAHPRYNLFSGLPLCTSETIDCLDCPKCGFSTNTADYQYLQICKIQRHGMFYASSRRGSRKQGRGGSRLCSSCQTTLSSSWQFCPGCGSKCESRKAGSVTIKEVEVKESPSPSDTSTEMLGSSSDSQDSSGIVRMVTPPKRHPEETTTNKSSEVSL